MTKVKKEEIKNNENKESKNKNLKNRNVAIGIGLSFGCVLILLVSILLIQKILISKKEEIKNPYDVTVSATDNFVLLGDSITDWYPVEEFFDDLPVVNSGVAGYHTHDILNNLKEMVFIYNPSKVFLLIGTNDVRDNPSIDQIVDNIKKIVKGINELRPEAKVYIESIYPINNTDNEKISSDAVGNRTNEVIQKINKKLKKYCQQEKITYIDMYSELVDQDGNLALKYTVDGLHLTNLGYLKVTKTLLPYFQD